MNNANRKPLPGTKLDYFDTRSAVDAIEPGAYDKLRLYTHDYTVGPGALTLGDVVGARPAAVDP